MKRFKLFIPVILVLCLMGQTVWAKKAYVTDEFRISLRRGPSIENKILKFLPSGQIVEVLESQEGWCRITVSAGENSNFQGWVLSRYLISRLPWEIQAKSLIKKNALLKERLAGIEKKQAGATRLEQDLTNTINTLTKENKELRSSERTKRFTIGALVLLCGLIIGQILGGQRKRRKSLIS
ncbi:MAG: SH3 domain-containing protein [Deltaproteobacteria bacterium]|nr:SH3 domain-containing protein [Deltaproteobacteria bacterium]MBW2660447.1 SH3 domain-containing protein [Deltaproteobacteria bacterium]